MIVVDLILSANLVVYNMITYIPIAKKHFPYNNGTCCCNNGPRIWVNVAAIGG